MFWVDEMLVILGFPEYLSFLNFSVQLCIGLLNQEISLLRRSGVTLQTGQVPQPECFCLVSMLFVMSSRFFFYLFILELLYVCFILLLLDIEKQFPLTARNDFLCHF